MALSDLDNKGFCVVKHLFSEDELNVLRKDYNIVNESTDPSDKLSPHFVDAVILPAGRKVDVRGVLEKVLTPLIGQINEQSIVKVNHVIPAPVYFSISNGIDLKWHQDHESYYQAKDHINYLNIYVPIYKPDPKLTGLSVINIEKLIKHDPSLSFLKGYGATTFFVENGKTIISDDNTDAKITLDYSIDDLADSPELEAGDALILRGDCIHKTQDTLTPRVSLSIRCVNLESKVKKSNFEATSDFKKLLFKNSADKIAGVLEKFKDTDEITLGELFGVKK